MATEIAIFPLREGMTPDDPNSLGGEILKDSFNTLTQQPGFQRAYWGREVENPSTFRLFVDWDSIDANMEFTKVPAFKPFLGRFDQMVHLDQALLVHAHYTPHPASAVLSAHVTPATEILTCYFPNDYSPSDQTAFDEVFKTFIAAVERDASSTHTASARGWIQEEVPVPGSSEKAKAYSALIGWRSVEDHMAYRETQSFKDHIGLLRNAKDLKRLAAVHYSGTLVEQGASGERVSTVQGKA